MYTSWDVCKEQVLRFAGAKHKSFKSRDEAAAFVNSHSQNRGFAASSGQAAAAAPAAKRRRKSGAAAAAEPSALDDLPADRPDCDAEPDAAAAGAAPAPAAAAGDEAAAVALPPISAATLYRLVSLRLLLAFRHAHPHRLQTTLDVDMFLLHQLPCAVLQEFDGASRGNPGLAGAGAVLMEDETRKEVQAVTCT